MCFSTSIYLAISKTLSYHSSMQTIDGDRYCLRVLPRFVSRNLETLTHYCLHMQLLTGGKDCYPGFLSIHNTRTHHHTTHTYNTTTPRDTTSTNNTNSYWLFKREMIHGRVLYDGIPIQVHCPSIIKAVQRTSLPVKQHPTYPTAITFTFGHFSCLVVVFN